MKYKKGQYVKWIITGYVDSVTGTQLYSKPHRIMNIENDKYYRISEGGYMHEGGLFRDKECIKLERENKLKRITKI